MAFPRVASLATLFDRFCLPNHNYFYTPFWYFISFLLVFLTASVAWRAVALKDLAFEWASSINLTVPRNLICGLDPPFSPEERVCADELPAFSDMQLVDQFSWAGRKYLIYERGE